MSTLKHARYRFPPISRKAAQAKPGPTLDSCNGSSHFHTVDHDHTIQRGRAWFTKLMRTSADLGPVFIYFGTKVENDNEEDLYILSPT